MLFKVIQKESKQLFSDKMILFIAIIQPIILIFVFGSSFQGSIENISTIVVDEDQTTFSGYIVVGVNQSDFFETVSIKHDELNQSIQMVNESIVRAVVHIPKGFGSKLNSSEAGEIKIYIDSSDYIIFNTLSEAQADILRIALENITRDIVGDIQTEKEQKSIQIDEIKELFRQLQKESTFLEADLIKSKEEIEGQTEDIDELDEKLNSIKEAINGQLESLNNITDALDDIIPLVQSINTTEQQKISTIVSGLQTIQSSLDQIKAGMSDLSRQLEDVKLASGSLGVSGDVEDRLRNMDSLLNKADTLSKSINLDFNKLDKGFFAQPVITSAEGVHGDIKYFDYLSAGIISLVVFFVGVIVPALNVIVEKRNNTLYRLSTTPARGSSIFVGKFIVFLFFGLIETAYTLLLSVFWYDLRISGSLTDALIVLFLLTCSAVAIGLLLSSVVKTLQQGLLIVPLIVIPAFLLSQTFFPGDIMPELMNKLSYMSPLTFSTHALREIMIKGNPLNYQSIDIIALGAFTLVSLILFIISYRRIKY